MSKILQIEEQKAIDAYIKGTNEQKTLLSNLLGASVFNRKITDRVKTFEDALAIVSMSQSEFNEEYGKAPQAQAFGKLEIIAKALNEGWKPNWDNSNEYKRYPYFEMKNGFSFFFVGNFYQYSAVGSRLCFRTEELACYAGQQFEDIYKAFMVL